MSKFTHVTDGIKFGTSRPLRRCEIMVDNPVPLHAERNVHVDFARVLCVACVVIHHAELRFAYEDYVSFQGCGYPLSNELWVLWYLVAISGFSFVMSRARFWRRILHGFFVFLLGCLLNMAALFSAGHPLRAHSVIYQMYYILVIIVLSVFTRPFKEFVTESRAFDPCNIIASVSVLLAVFAYSFLYSKDCAYEHVSLLTILCVEFAGFVRYVKRSTSKSSIICAMMCVTFCAWEALTRCRAKDHSRVLRFVFWWFTGCMYGLATSMSPSDARGNYREYFQNYASYVSSYWMIFILLFTFGQPTLQTHRYVDLVYYDTVVSTIVALRDVTLVALLYAIFVIRVNDPANLCRPLGLWSIVAYVTHQAVYYTFAAPSSSSPTTLSYPHSVEVVQLAATTGCVLSASLFVVYDRYMLHRLPTEVELEGNAV